jgi:putative chitinase
MIDAATLLKIAPQAHDAEAWAPALDQAARIYMIDTECRMAMWLAQLAHESAGFTRFEENLNYSAAGLRSTFGKYFPTTELAERYARQPERIANRVYADRLGNGGEASGDGWKYRGRGELQLTGKANYAKYGAALGIDLVNFPDKAAEPDAGALIAALYWHDHGLNEIADAGDEASFAKITRKINGGMNGWPDRVHWWKRAKQHIGA